MRIDEINKINAALNEIKSSTPSIVESIRQTGVGVFAASNQVKIEGLVAPVATQPVAKQTYGTNQNMATSGRLNSIAMGGQNIGTNNAIKHLG